VKVVDVAILFTPSALAIWNPRSSSASVKSSFMSNVYATISIPAALNFFPASSNVRSGTASLHARNSSRASFGSMCRNHTSVAPSPIRFTAAIVPSSVNP
jgi:hypothetical protein